jgi:integrase/recombinase XerD
MNKSLVPRNVSITQASRIVSYLTPEEVNQIAETAKQERNGKRDYLLVITLFQTGLRISEALSLTPRSISQYESKPVLSVLGKGKKLRMVACPEPLADKLKSYAYSHKLELDDRFFPIDRRRAWQIIKRASEKAGINKRVYCHLFRHSDAIERLRQTGNPKALQHHLGHSSPLMTMRYLSTLQQEDSLRIQQEVEFD